MFNSDNVSIFEYQNYIDSLLAKHNIPFVLPKESVILLAHVLGQSLSFIHLNPEYKLSSTQIKQVEEYTDRRIQNEPLAYILGEAPFRELQLYVNPNVLIPRPETEILVQKALDIFNTNQTIHVLDMGSGSGGVSLALAYERKNTVVTAVDIDEKALLCAKRNYTRYQKEITRNNSNVIFQQSNWLEKVNKQEKFDLCITNPPYIPTKELAFLDESVKNFEPMKALDGGSDGLYFYVNLAANLADYLKPNGYLLLEQGFDQTKDIQNSMSLSELEFIEVSKDLKQQDRIQVYRKNENTRI